ncbi:glycosyltransferase family 4 protein [Fodinibius sediminis]|uniref:Glycosyltransferase involved in cell wall bisynthesis n=1 Tax=Fodinibius sediminis TaxID=1214077 RepID=A0A521EUL2_9BACT|nr:glycosyltransferase family 4 protein [Fodinibius sediminis]SMO87597.1 Glycosyltransferase involved in cell wall bisynthesis [Fodinibius sediminis]
MPPLKVLVITNAYPSEEKKYAGIFVKNQVEWLQHNSDFIIQVFALKRSFTGLLGSIKKYIMCYLRFLKQVRKHYDILHLHFLSPLIILPFVYKIFHPSAKVFLTMHGSDINNLENKLLIRLYRKLISCVDEIICVGRSMEESVNNKLHREVNYFLCAGINTDAIYSLHKPYDERDIDFLYVGSFYKVKGTDKLIEAFKMVNHDKMKIVFIGSGHFQDEIGELRRERNLSVQDDLTQDEINEYYNRSKFFIFPSRSEGFGLSLAEAMYCGTPGIISNLKQLKHQVTDGYNGYVCKQTTTSELAKIIVKALEMESDVWKLMSRNAMKEAQKYSIDSVGKTLKKMYERVGR